MESLTSSSSRDLNPQKSEFSLETESAINEMAATTAASQALAAAASAKFGLETRVTAVSSSSSSSTSSSRQRGNLYDFEYLLKLYYLNNFFNF
jgi:hypothetical protein